MREPEIGNAPFVSLLLAIPVLACQVRNHTDQEAYTAVFDNPLFGLDRL